MPYFGREPGYKGKPSTSQPDPNWTSIISAIREAQASTGNKMITVAEAQLSNMKGANADWKAQNIESPNELATQLAWRILTVADVLEFVPQYVAASADGGVAICFSTGEVYADVECFNTGEVWALIAKPGSEPMSWAVNTATDNDVAAALRDINSSVLVHA